METENSQNPQQGIVGNPGFIILLKTSFQIFAQNWKHFVKMTLALLVPAFVLGGILFFIAMSFGVHAAPKMPGQSPAIILNPATDKANSGMNAGITGNENQVFSNVKSVFAGSKCSFAIKNDGSLWAWGFNEDGRLGSGSQNQAVPLEIKNIMAPKPVIISNFDSRTVELMDDGSLQVWDKKIWPDGSKNVPGISGFMDVATGYYATIALKKDGTVWSWDNKDPQVLFTQVPVLDHIKDIDAGMDHYLAVKSDGTVWAWGNNLFGGLGNGTKNSDKTPAQVKGLEKIIAVEAGDNYSLALKEDGTVWSWGNQAGRSRDDGTYENSLIPAQVQDISGINQISANPTTPNSMALDKDGKVWGWGPTTAPNYNKPAEVLELTGIASIASGDTHKLAVKSDGTVLSWGSNDYGQLGDGTLESSSKMTLENGHLIMRSAPVQVKSVFQKTQTAQKTISGVEAQKLGFIGKNGQPPNAVGIPETAIGDHSLSFFPGMNILGLLFGFMGLIFIVLYIPFLLYSMVIILSMVRLTVLITQSSEIKIWEIIKWSLKKLGSYILLSIRIFLYSAWPTILIMIGIMIVYTGTSFTSGALGFVNNAFAQTSSFFNNHQGGAPNAVAQSTMGSNILTLVNYFLGLLGLLSILLIVYRAPRCAFAQYVLAEKNCSSKEALRDSISVSKGNWWKIFGYGFILAFVTGLCSGILTGIFNKINPLAGSVINFLITVFCGYIMLIFFYALYNVCKMLNANKGV